MRPYTTPYPDTVGAAQFAPAMSDYTEAAILAANTSLRIAVPAGARFVGYSFDGDVWVLGGTSNVTAAVPSATTGDGSAPALNPTQRLIPTGITHIALVADAARKGTLSFWA